MASDRSHHFECPICGVTQTGETPVCVSCSYPIPEREVAPDPYADDRQPPTTSVGWYALDPEPDIDSLTVLVEEDDPPDVPTGDDTDLSGDDPWTATDARDPTHAFSGPLGEALGPPLVAGLLALDRPRAQRLAGAIATFRAEPPIEAAVLSLLRLRVERFRLFVNDWSSHSSLRLRWAEVLECVAGLTALRSQGSLRSSHRSRAWRGPVDLPALTHAFSLQALVLETPANAGPPLRVLGWKLVDLWIASAGTAPIGVTDHLRSGH